MLTDSALPRLLGTAGVVPFVALAVLTSVPGPYEVVGRFALVAYGAIILSFVGALHWAFAMLLEALSGRARTWHLVWSVVPALIGWVALLLPPVVSIILLLVGFGSQFIVDRQLAGRASLPAWYLPLRRGLTLTVSLTLLLALFAVWV